MMRVTEVEIKKRLAFDNPWWEEARVDERFSEWPRRAYFDGFYKLFKESTVHRAVVLMGPRRVGKTVMLTQTVQQLIDDGIEPKRIFYVSVDTPTYIGLSLESMLWLFLELGGHTRTAPLFVMFDEVQYLEDWERHLKSVVDSYPSIRFVASGSAAASLKTKSQESGAGRFTDFLLPPLSFVEFLRFSNLEEEILGNPATKDSDFQQLRDVGRLNQAFLDYTNFGGFPEAVLDDEVRRAMNRFIANDVIDKVLLRDLPSLYGIADTQDLNRLFTYLAHNTGGELTYEGVAHELQIAKNTIRKYLDYLATAFLIHRLYRVDQNARRLTRVTSFKVYLTNPSIRAALFGPIETMESLPELVAETAAVSQFAQSALAANTYYARWKNGEVNLVTLTGPKEGMPSVTEIKWSNRAVEQPAQELKALFYFCKQKGITEATVTTRDKFGTGELDGVTITYVPLSWYCYFIGTFAIENPLRQGLHRVTPQRLIESHQGGD